jgi:hypothetical protein
MKSSAMVLFQLLTVDDNEPCICQLLLIILLLQFHNGIRDCHYLYCLAILLPERSPWKRLYKNTNPESFLHMTGLTRGSFASLVNYFIDFEDIVYRCSCRHGRPLSLSPDGHLGLLLFYLGSKMQYRHLCLIFGITPSVCSRAIYMMLRRMV